MEGTIFKIKKYALHDGPGIRTTVFFKGCPLSCRWCHNPEGISPLPQPMKRSVGTGEIDEVVGKTIGVDELVEEIEKDLLFYDESGGGVTFSGGEPLAQLQFLEAVLAACNHREIHATLDTSGFAPAAALDRVLPRLQLVLFDLKIMDTDRHRRYTGVSNRVIFENLRRIAGSNFPVRIRVPVIPGITDDDDNIREIARVAVSVGTVQGIDLLPFHRIGEEKYRRLGLENEMARISSPTLERIDKIKFRFESEGFDVTIGG